MPPIGVLIAYAGRMARPRTIPEAGPLISWTLKVTNRTRSAIKSAALERDMTIAQYLDWKFSTIGGWAEPNRDADYLPVTPSETPNRDTDCPHPSTAKVPGPVKDLVRCTECEARRGADGIWR